MKDIPVTGKWQMRSDNDLEMLFLNPRRAGKAINARLKDVVFLLDQNKKSPAAPSAVPERADGCSLRRHLGQSILNAAYLIVVVAAVPAKVMVNHDR